MDPVNNTVNHKTAWAVLILVALVALGLVWWAVGASYPAVTTSVPAGQTVPAGTNGTGAGAGAGARAGTGASGTGAGTSAGTGSTAPHRDLALKISSFISNDQNSLPKMEYTLTGNVQGDTISIVGKFAGEVVYLNQQPVNASNSYSLDLGNLTRTDGTKTSVAPGEYFLRIRDKDGKILTESGNFTVALGNSHTQ